MKKNKERRPRGLLSLLNPAVLALLSAVMACQLLVSQTFTASLNGKVVDPTGSFVAGAPVALKNMATNDTRRATTGEGGTYEFANLAPGTYEISVAPSGFKSFVRRDLVLHSGTAASLNVTLELGSTEQTVEVSGQSVLLDTETANHSVTMETQLVSALPTNTRSPLNFVFALAGTTPAQGGMTSPSATSDQMFSMFGLQGGRSGNAQILLDGAPATAPDWGGLMVSPAIDSVQEMQVIQNTYDAQYTKSGAGVVALITKGGTTRFHGTAYDFLRNDNLDANSWSNNRYGAPRGEFKRNQFGANLSGPILKRYNLFFFGAYEGLRQPQTESGLFTVPTALERQGNFSQTFNSNGTLATIYNPFSTRQVTDAAGNTIYTRDAFPGNQIPSSLFDSVGQRLVNLYPAPNRPGEGATHINNYYNQGRGLVTNDKVDWRVDWAQSQKNRTFARMSQRLRETYTPACFFCNGADTSAVQTNPGYQVTVNDTLTPGPTWVLDMLVGASRWSEGQTSLAFGKLSPGQIGLTPTDYQAPVLPSISINGYSSMGNNSFRRLTRYSDTAQVNATKQLSRHTLKFGASYDVALMNNLDEISGNFSFSRGLTSCDPATSGAVCSAQQVSSTASGNGIASMLLGTGTGNVESRPDKAMSLHSYGAYIQDAWRVSDRLTVNVGLRYENQRPATERYNRLAFFNEQVVSPISGAVAGALGRPVYGGFQFADSKNRYGWPAENKDFAPRIGLAYKVTDRLVARAGFGIFYLPVSAMISYDDPGQFLGYTADTPWVGTVNGLGYNPSTRVSNIFPNGVNQPTGGAKGLLTYVGQGVGQAWPVAPHPAGYTEHFSTDFQYRLSANSVLEVGYTGTRGRKLMYGNPDINANQLPTEYLSLGSKLDQVVSNPFYGVITDTSSPLSGPTVHYNQLLRPYPQFTYLNWTRSLPGGRSSFNALNVKFNYAFHNGLSLLSTYQYSRAMDNGSEDYIGWIMGSSWRDSNNTKLDYSISAHDMPQSFVTAMVYQLPYGHGKHWGSSAPKIVNHALGNWQLSTIVKLNSGLPVFPIYVNTWNNPLSAYGFPGHERPNLVGNPVPANRTPDNWINASAFQEPGAYSYGNAPRYIDSLRESPDRNVDLSVSKDFKTEAFRIQFRAEFLNLFNHPVFGGGNQWGANIQNCLQCGNFGQVTGTRNDPRNIQLGLKAEFD